MDRRERSGEAMTSLLAAFEGWQNNIQTAMPGIIQSFNPAKRTVVIQPAIQAQVMTPAGVKTWISLPLLLDCPVFFPSGGGVTLTFPIKQGDECLVVFAQRCIDNWWAKGGINSQAEFRMHDLSDGFCFAGVSSVPEVIPAISSNTAQLRNDAGTTYIELNPLGSVTVKTDGDVTVTCGGSISATASGSVSVVAPTINLTGDVSIIGSLAITGSGSATGTLSASEVTAGSVVLSTHTHPSPAGGNTGPPN